LKKLAKYKEHGSADSEIISKDNTQKTASLKNITYTSDALKTVVHGSSYFFPLDMIHFEVEDIDLVVSERM